MVVARWTFSRTNSGNLGEMPATNKRINVEAMISASIAAGKIAEGWVVYDCMGMMQQMGVVPGPGGD